MHARQKLFALGTGDTRRREELVRTVWRIMARRGPAAVTMRQISAEAGYANGALKTYFAGKGVPAQAVTVLDVDSTSTGATDPFAAVKAGFATLKSDTATAGGAAAVFQNYHSGLVFPFCHAAARGYFTQFSAP